MRYLFLVLAIFATSSFAQEYKWYANWIGPGTLYDSPAQICGLYPTATNGDGTKFIPAGPQYLRDDWFYCTERVVQTNGNTAVGVYNGFAAVRVGDSCPENKAYNNQTGMCEAPEEDKCLSTSGKSVNNEVDGGEIGSASPAPPGSVCSDQCQYVFSYEPPITAYRFVQAKDGKDLNHAYFKYRYQGNGTSCTQNNPGSSGSVFDQPSSKPPIDTKPTSFTEAKCGEWSTTGDGIGTRTCTETKEYVDPGKLNCAGATGTLVCQPKTPVPDYEKTTTTANTTTKPVSGGGTTTTTETNTTTTTCFGVKPCSTSSTDKTTQTGTDGQGNDTGTSETCTGDDCKGEGDSDEDDGSTCDLVANPSGCESTGTTDGGDTVCDAPIACEGDVFQCAILRQSHRDTCALLDGPTDQELADQEQKRLGEISKVDGYQQSLDGDINGYFSSFQGEATGTQYAGTCFKDQNFDIDGHSFVIPFSQVCPYLAWFRFALIAVAYLWAARIISKAF